MRVKALKGVEGQTNGAAMLTSITEVPLKNDHHGETDTGSIGRLFAMKVICSTCLKD